MSMIATTLMINMKESYPGPQYNFSPHTTLIPSVQIIALWLLKIILRSHYNCYYTQFQFGTSLLFVFFSWI
jgi:hypothetical protein